MFSGPNPAQSLHQLLIATAWVLGIGFLLFYGYYLWQADGVRDMWGHVLGRDFSAVWGALLLLGEGNMQGIYDTATYNQRVVAFSGVPLSFIWTYPPHLFLLLAPLGFLSYIAALYSWLLGGLALLLTVIRRICQWRASWLLLLLSSPAFIYNFFAGQNGFLTASLLMGALLLLERRPAISAACIALLTMKPQLGPLLPVVLIAERRWKVLGLTLFFIGLLVAVSTLWLGVDAWVGCFNAMRELSQLVWADGLVGEFRYNSPMLISSLYLLGLPAIIAVPAQILFSITVIIYSYRALRRSALAAEELFILTILATFLASPYLYNYDMTSLVLAALFWLRNGLKGEMNNREAWCVLLLWLAPILTIIFNKLGAPLMPLLLGYTFWVFTKRLK